MKVRGRLTTKKGHVGFDAEPDRRRFAVDVDVLAAAGLERPKPGERVNAWALLDGRRAKVVALSTSEEGLPMDRPPGGRPHLQPPRMQKQAMRNFHNPYNFVPFVPRPTREEVEKRMDAVPSGERPALQDALDLVDGPPPGHHSFLSDRLHGWLDVELTTITPLLLPGKGREGPAGHFTFEVLTRNRRPWIPPTSLKGALRAAYECVTNSRLPRFDVHQARLGFRMGTTDGLPLVPARVVDDGVRIQVQLLPGTSTIGAQGPDGPMYAAWLPRYAPLPALRRSDYDALPAHGEEVDAWVVKRRHRTNFSYWEVFAIAAPGHLGPQPDAEDEVRGIRGWVVVTNRNIGRKHHERVFFTERQGAVHAFEGDAAADLRARWSDVIRGYRRAHTETELHGDDGSRDPAEYCGHQPGRTAWSTHLYAEDTLPLGNGQGGATLCYVRLDGDRVTGLFPVNISRDLFEHPPHALVPPDQLPATTWVEFSPADRVFGWVHEKSGEQSRRERAYRGHVRVGPVECRTEDPIESFVDAGGLPLAILGAPKPQQGRFYVGRPDGSAQDDGLSRADAGYNDATKVLRGRKVYPHHRGLPDSVWDHPLMDRTQNRVDGWSQEYRRPRNRAAEQRDTQNRSIDAWVKRGAVFRTRIHFDNLAPCELGALLYVLDHGGEERMLRLGGGKPLGFGSVRASVVDSHIGTGETKAEALLALSAVPVSTLPCEPLHERFVAANRSLYPDSLMDGLPVHVAAYRQASRGYEDDKPVHYPRASASPAPEGENYRWFVTNDRRKRFALADLLDDLGLPLDPE